MKEYKVGDTIYMKGKVKEVNGIAWTYYADFGNGTAGWITSDNILDELPTAEPVKPVLPKAVGEEISFAKSIGATFEDYIVRELIRSDYKDTATYKMIQSPDVPNVIETLLKAWDNGYTVKTEKKYNIKVPHAVISYFKKTDANCCIAGDTFYVDLDEDLAQFTEAEIEHYGLQACEKEEVTDDEQ